MRPFNAFYGALQSIYNPWIHGYFYNALYQNQNLQSTNFWTLKERIYPLWYLYFKSHTHTHTHTAISDSIVSHHIQLSSLIINTMYYGLINL